MSTALRAGQVADAVGINIETLRYYERRGIIPMPDRSLGGHRVYDDDTVTILRVIKAAQRLGFSLDEVAELLEAGRHRHGAGAGLQARAEAKLVEINEKIADLEVIRDSLIAARDAGCDDLIQCAGEECCPIPFVQIGTRPEPSRALSFSFKAPPPLRCRKAVPCGGHGSDIGLRPRSLGAGESTKTCAGDRGSCTSGVIGPRVP